MTYMRDSSVVIEVFPNSQGKLIVSRVIKWDRDKEGNLQYKFNTTQRVARMKTEPKVMQNFFTTLGVPSVFYNKTTGQYHKRL
jgi:hypothetical protein